MSEGADESEGPGRSWGTWLLLGLCISVFFAMVLGGAGLWSVGIDHVVAAGGIHPPRIWGGEIWRLLAACFVHVAVWHLALNMFVLLQLGTALERMIGTSRFLLVYLSSGIFGFALSVGLRGNPTAGASGAIFGVTGALLAIALLARHQRLGRVLLGALVPFVVATVVLGLVVEMVDNLAHIGGLIFGFLVGFGLIADDATLLRAQGTSPPPARKSQALLALAASAILFLAAGAYAARPVLSPRYHATMGLIHLMGKRFDEAEAHAARAARLAPEDGNALILVGRIRGEKATTAEEEAEARRLLTEGLLRMGEADLARALARAQLELALYGGTPELPIEDTRTTNALCDAALELFQAGHEGDEALLKNECAWLKLKAPDATVRDPPQALKLAREAVAASEEKNAAILHTLAEALAQTGDAAEGAAVLERLLAEGRAGELPGGAAWLRAEISRLRRADEGGRASAGDAAGSGALESPAWP